MRQALAAAALRTFLPTFLLVVVAGTPALAGTEDLLIRLLIQKGILTEEEYQAFKKGAEAMATTPAQPPSTPQELAETLRDEVRQELRRREEASIAIALKVEGEARWRARQGVGNRDRGATSDLFLRRAEVVLEAEPVDFLLARLVLNNEWLGAQTTDQGQPVDESVKVDEGTLRLAAEGFPLYGVVGKRTQPFGGFFSHLVSDPMSQDASEVKQVGGTLGFTPGIWGADLSVTLYRGEKQLSHFFESGLFDSSVVVRSTSVGLRRETDDVSSFILSSTLWPVKDLRLGAAYLSEPGDGQRNQTGSVWAGYSRGRITAAAEFVTAIARERYVLQGTGQRFGRSFEETMAILGLAYKPSKSLELATRVERLWDDGLAGRAEAWSALHRLGIGAGYTLYERDEIGVRLLGEYRFTDYRRGGAAREVAAPDQHEIFAKLGVSYK